MLAIIEESYKISVWCREIVDSLRQEARKKRVSLIFSSDINDITRDSGDSVIIVGAETKWLDLATKTAKTAGKHPIILSNQSDSTQGGGVSRVTDDIFGSMSEIFDIFASNGRKAIALYAVNPESASDSFKKEAFSKLGGADGNVFVNQGSLQACFESFYEKHSNQPFGGIVCANDFAAISLIRHLRSINESIDGIDIISYSDTLIAKCTSPAVSTVRANFKSFGQLAFLIADCISKGDHISGIRLLCNWEIIHRDTSSAIPAKFPKETSPPALQSGSFYGDEELMEMMRIETLLSDCDKTDLEIISAILDGKKSAEIADSCFIAETALKYRIKKMKDICHAESREKLKYILSKYISHGIDNHISLSYN